MNEMQTKPQKMPFSLAITTKGYNEMISRSIRDPKDVKRFVAAITSAVAVNPALQECDPATVLSGALLGNSLGLSPSPQLGQYYLVPYWNKKKGCNDAQFQLGYKGYVQLALRSGQYKHLNVIAVKAGEMVRFDPLTEEVDFRMIEDDEEREKAATIGYLATLEYLNGFRKTIYWSREKMEKHALRYSKGYAAKKGYTFWEKEFDAMAFKTMLRQLISKWGIMSIELQTAFEQDTVVNEDYMEPVEPINPAPVELPEPEPYIEMPADAPVEAEEVVNLNDL